MSFQVTPLIQQYLDIKKKYSSELIFFQVGDFYELFFKDAEIAASILSITLTKRGQFEGKDIPLCGVPVHMIEHYYPKLVRAGHTVILCDQVEEAQVGKLVRRAVVDVITPSTLCTDEVQESIYSLFICLSENGDLLVFWFEFLEQRVFYNSYHQDQNDKAQFRSVFEKYRPKEIIVKKLEFEFFYNFLPKRSVIKSFLSDCIPQEENNLLNQYKLDKNYLPLCQLFGSYLKTYFEKITVTNSLFFKKDESDLFLFLDESTFKYLECVSNQKNNSKENTLYEFLDKTVTKMGSRLLKKWILYPLKKKELIEKRQSIVSFFKKNYKLREQLLLILQEFGDIERLFQKIRLEKIKDKDLKKLVYFTEVYEKFKNYSNLFSFSDENFNFFISDGIIKEIKKYSNVDESICVEGEMVFIRPDCDERLQQYYLMTIDQKKIIADFLQQEKEKTGIADLVIKKTAIYEYTFELSKIKERQNQIPLSYTRVQTLAQKERFVSIELQKLSAEMNNALVLYRIEEKNNKDIFLKILRDHQQELLAFAESCALLDVYCSLASIASEKNWICPLLTDSGQKLVIEQGKHPLFSDPHIKFVANSLLMDEDNKTYLITGPNMGGKSTYMRQNALLIILSHIGSFIPAKKAEIPIMNAVFTRIGASDSMVLGKSTFFVELEEIANIIQLADEKSFIIIDEIGRGTSTYDGMALAAAIIDYLVNKKKSYILCSTHYHELSELLETVAIEWYVMQSILQNNMISFLYTLIPGKADTSMGISLARKIGFPDSILNKAETYFIQLQKKEHKSSNQNNSAEEKINLTSKNNIDKEELKTFLQNKLIDDISPRQAYEILSKICEHFSL